MRRVHLVLLMALVPLAVYVGPRIASTLALPGYIDESLAHAGLAAVPDTATTVARSRKNTEWGESASVSFTDSAASVRAWVKNSTAIAAVRPTEFGVLLKYEVPESASGASSAVTIEDGRVTPFPSVQVSIYFKSDLQLACEQAGGAYWIIAHGRSCGVPKEHARVPFVCPKGFSNPTDNGDGDGDGDEFYCHVPFW